jgi:hypothetical protein
MLVASQQRSLSPFSFPDAGRRLQRFNLDAFFTRTGLSLRLTTPSGAFSDLIASDRGSRFLFLRVFFTPTGIHLA